MILSTIAALLILAVWSMIAKWVYSKRWPKFIKFILMVLVTLFIVFITIGAVIITAFGIVIGAQIK